MSSKNSENQWHRVGSDGKNKKLSKNEKKQLANKLPKVEDLPPLEIEKTSFEVLDYSSKKPTKNQSNHDNNVSKNSKLAQKKNSKKPAKQKQESVQSFKDIEEALQKVSLDDIILKSQKQSATFSNLIFLKDFASLYNAALVCPDESLGLVGKAFDYPLSVVPKKTIAILQDLLVSKSSSTERRSLYQHFIKSLTDNIETGQHSWGFRICIQILAHYSPSDCCTDLDRHLENINTRKNIPKRCLVYMWALGQNGVKNSKYGMEVWLKVMLPLLGLKSLTQFSVSYIEELLKNTKDVQSELSGTISADQFMRILQWCFDTSTNLNKQLRMRLRNIYPDLKKIALSSNNCFQVMEKFLGSSLSEVKNYKKEFLDVAIDCLGESEGCYSVWREMYTDSFPMTRELLIYFHNDWDTLWNRVYQGELEETMKAFYITNVQAAQQSSSLTSRKEFKEIYAICEELHAKEENPKKISSSIFKWPLIVAFIAIGVAFSYDLYSHGGILENTATYVKLESIGAIIYLKHAWANVKYASYKVMLWLQENVFPFLLKIGNILWPYVEALGGILLQMWKWFLVNTEGVREILKDYLEAAFVWSDKWFTHALEVMWPYIEAVSTAVIEFSTRLIKGEISWCCVKGYVYTLYETFSGVVVRVWAGAIDYISGTGM